MQFALDPVVLVALLLAAARILAWSLIAPPLATAGVPFTIKVVVSVALGMAVLPLTRTHVPSLDTAAVGASVIMQVAIGAALGFLTRLVFAAVEAAGSLIDVFGGFSLAAAYDPLSTTMTSIFGRFYGMLCTTLIFATNIHLVIFGGFLRTFSSLPLDAHPSLSSFGTAATKGLTDMFVAALQIAGPLIVVLFIADIALGVLNRIAPQLNAFSLSFPVKIGLTLLLGGTALLLMPQTVADLADHASAVVGSVAG